MPWTNEQRREHKRKRLEAGLCETCGKPRGEDGTGNMCRKCADKGNERRYPRNGYCINCHLPLEKGNKTLRCKICSTEANENRKKVRADRKKSRVCITCGDSNIITSGEYTECYQCYLRRMASRHLKSGKRWQELHILWEKQNGKCPYTGTVLQFGIDSSLDHILPSSRYPELQTDSNNLEWVHIRVNRMKQDMTKGEFINLMKSIIKNIEG